jgi:hypothetical protein
LISPVVFLLLLVVASDDAAEHDIVRSGFWQPPISMLSYKSAFSYIAF